MGGGGGAWAGWAGAGWHSRAHQAALRTAPLSFHAMLPHSPRLCLRPLCCCCRSPLLLPLLLLLPPGCGGPRGTAPAAPAPPETPAAATAAAGAAQAGGGWCVRVSWRGSGAARPASARQQDATDLQGAARGGPSTPPPPPPAGMTPCRRRPPHHHRCHRWGSGHAAQLAGRAAGQGRAAAGLPCADSAPGRRVWWGSCPAAATAGVAAGVAAGCCAAAAVAAQPSWRPSGPRLAATGWRSVRWPPHAAASMIGGERSGGAAQWGRTAAGLPSHVTCRTSNTPGSLDALTRSTWRSASLAGCSTCRVGWREAPARPGQRPPGLPPGAPARPPCAPRRPRDAMGAMLPAPPLACGLACGGVPRPRPPGEAPLPRPAPDRPPCDALGGVRPPREPRPRPSRRGMPVSVPRPPSNAIHSSWGLQRSMLTIYPLVSP